MILKNFILKASTSGTGEMAYLVEHLLCKSDELSSGPQNPHKVEQAGYVCNPSAPTARCEADTRTSLGTPPHSKQQENLCQAKWKVEANNQGCFLTFTCVS